MFLVQRSTPTHFPLRKSNSLQQSQQSIVTDMTEDSLRRGSEESFVVHRGKNIPTLRSVVQDEPLMPARLRVNYFIYYIYGMFFKCMYILKLVNIFLDYT